MPFAIIAARQSHSRHMMAAPDARLFGSCRRDGPLRRPVRAGHLAGRPPRPGDVRRRVRSRPQPGRYDIVPGIVGATIAGIPVDIGVVLLALGMLLACLDPSLGARAFARIDWSTAFLVGGIVTYVGVLQKLDAVNLLGRAAMGIGTPFLAALVICMIAALVSAFASTTGVLAALVPMAVPLASSGAVPGWALITTLGVSATIVDASPFSNTGATLVASTAEENRPRLRVMLLRWSMAMVVVGPIVLLPLLLLIGR